MCKFTKESNKTYFKSITDSGIMENKKFCQTIKPFITNKCGLSNRHIMLLENNSLISDEKELVTLFNTHYINIVEKSSGLKPNSINFNKAKDKSALIKEIILPTSEHSGDKKCKPEHFRFL